MAIKKRTKILLAVGVGAFLAIIIFYDFAPDRALKRQIQTQYFVRDPQFTHSINALLGPQLLPGNETETLLNGDEVFPSQLDAIRGAQKSISFETYIYWSGEVGKLFTDALCERSLAGVRVHVLLDWVGTGKMDRSLLRQMESAGIDVVRYHPVPWFSFEKLNNRTHRKILVVDGKIGFTGGLGVADHWLGHAQSPEHWRDTHYRFEGPVVAQMQAAFIDNWLESTGELLHGDTYFPELESAGDELAQVFKSSPREGAENARLMYLYSIAAAQQLVEMSNAYFVPDDFSVDTMVKAARRGVRIRIIAPGEVTDTDLVRFASRSRWKELLKAGVEFYEYQPTMYHCKVMVVDGIWSSVGSTNFDNRSFRLNDEVNLNIMDEAFAREQHRIFEDDLRHCKRITMQDWENSRTFVEKVRDWSAGLLRNLL